MRQGATTMGHFTETRKVRFSDAATGYSALDCAVDSWRNDSDSDGGDARLAHFDATPMMTPAAANYLAYQDADFEITSDRSAVIPLCSTDDAVASAHTVSVTVPGSALHVDHLLYGALRRSLREQFGLVLAGFKVVDLPEPGEAAAVDTDGEIVIRYSVIKQRGAMFSRPDGDFATLPEARAAALDLMSRTPDIISARVEAFVSRKGGETALVNLTRPVADEVVVGVEVNLSTPKTGAKQDAWLVSFDYHN